MFDCVTFLQVLISLALASAGPSCCRACLDHARPGHPHTVLIPRSLSDTVCWRNAPQRGSGMARWTGTHCEGWRCSSIPEKSIEIWEHVWRLCAICLRLHDSSPFQPGFVVTGVCRLLGSVHFKAIQKTGWGFLLTLSWTYHLSIFRGCVESCYNKYGDTLGYFSTNLLWGAGHTRTHTHRHHCASLLSNCSASQKEILTPRSAALGNGFRRWV